MLIRLRGCAGWCAPLLFANGINRFSHDVAQLKFDFIVEKFHWLVCCFRNLLWISHKCDDGVTTINSGWWCKTTNAQFTSLQTQMSQLMKLWYFPSSVNSFFKRACTAIQWGQISDFWSDLSSTSILHVCEERRLWRLRGCAGSHEPSLVAYVISTIISWAGSIYVLTIANIQISRTFQQRISSDTLLSV